MKHKLYFGIMLLLLLLPLATAKEYYYEDDNLGLVTINVKESALERALTWLQSQTLSIAVTKKTVEIGDTVGIQIITEVPCSDRSGKRLSNSDISTAKFVITDPNRKTTNIDIKAKIGVCQSNQLKFSITPRFEGTYYVHYVVMQGVYPALLIKEITDFKVVSGSPECDKEELTAWKFLYNIQNGKLYNQFKLTYDDNCELSGKKTYYKTTCNSGYVIEGSTQSFASGQKRCVKEEVVVDDDPVQYIDDEEQDDEPADDIPTPAPGCTKDIIQVCEDGTQITAYTCASGILIPTDEKCSTNDEGGQGEIPLTTLLFSLEFYGYHMLALGGIIILGILIVLVLALIPNRGKR